MAKRVTVTDLETNVTESFQIENDYFLTCDGQCDVSHIQAYSSGTHVVTIRGREHAEAALVRPEELNP